VPEKVECYREESWVYRSVYRVGRGDVEKEGDEREARLGSVSSDRFSLRILNQFIVLGQRGVFGADGFSGALPVQDFHSNVLLPTRLLHWSTFQPERLTRPIPTTIPSPMAPLSCLRSRAHGFLFSGKSRERALRNEPLTFSQAPNTYTLQSQPQH